MSRCLSNHSYIWDAFSGQESESVNRIISSINFFELRVGQFFFRIDDVLSCGISVKIQEQSPVKDDNYTISDIDNEIKRTKSESDRIKALIQKNHDVTDATKALYQRLDLVGGQLNRLKQAKLNGGKVMGKRTYLGMFDPMSRTIILYRDKLDNNLDRVVSTYVHEIFHAYYFLHNSSKSYVREIEEPIVEFSMLTFLKAFDGGRFFNAAYKAVTEKQVSGYLSAYGFGSYIYDNIDDKGGVMEKYMQRRSSIAASSQAVKDLKSDLYPLYPFDHEAKVLNTLCQILNIETLYTSCTLQCYNCCRFCWDSASDDEKSVRMYAVVRYFVRKVFWLIWSPYSLNAELQKKNIVVVINDDTWKGLNHTALSLNEETVLNSMTAGEECSVSELLSRLCRCLPVMIGGPVSKVENPSILQGNDDKENTIKFIALGKYVETLPKFYFTKVDTAAELMRQILSGELSFLKYYTIGDRTLEEIAAIFLKINHLENTAPRALNVGNE